MEDFGRNLHQNETVGVATCYDLLGGQERDRKTLKNWNISSKANKQVRKRSNKGKKMEETDGRGQKKYIFMAEVKDQKVDQHKVAKHQLLEKIWILKSLTLT